MQKGVKLVSTSVHGFSNSEISPAFSRIHASEPEPNSGPNECVVQIIHAQLI